MSRPHRQGRVPTFILPIPLGWKSAAEPLCPYVICLHGLIPALLIGVLLAATGVPSVRCQTPIEPSLDAGFTQMYNADFVGARNTIQDFERVHPEDPMGPTAEAASYLFEEFSRQGVLTSAFFLDNKKLLGGVDQPPDPVVRVGFLDGIARARAITSSQLAANAGDTRALLAVTMCAGMQSDYESLIEKKALSSLHYLREAQDNAGKLLVADPSAGDAYVATGVADYIVGCMPGYKRAFLSMGGIHGNRPRGMEEVRTATQQAHYLKPFAQLLLALASLREGLPSQARDLYALLVKEFPDNPLFPGELALATVRADASKPCHSSTPC
jgi:hypothetical protein